ncbi:hypothetical protein [Paracoccus yeei]|uniref:hypothetical protein n=1 Tax=Paracoccus yeei TaxID=147645 RepID=UPI003BF855C2
MPDQNNAPDAGLAAFAEYFRRNYPGPDTVIMNPDWHAPRIWRAAVQAYEADPNRYRQAADLARADRAAPEGQVRAVVDAAVAWWEDRVPRDTAESNLCAAIAALTPPPAAPTDNTALVEEQRMKEHYRNCWKAQLERANGLEAAIASREAPPASQQEAVTEITEAKEILSRIGTYAGGMDYSRIVTAVGHIDAALRALKGGA